MKKAASGLDAALFCLRFDFLEDIGDGCGERAERAIAEGIGKPRARHKAAEGNGAARRDELLIACKRLAVIFFGEHEEPEGDRLRQTVVDIVEGALEDMRLILPSCALLEVGNALIGEIGTVLLL